MCYNNLDLMHDGTLLINSPPSLTFKMQMFPRGQELKRISAWNVEKVCRNYMGARCGGVTDQQNAIMHEVYWRLTHWLDRKDGRQKWGGSQQSWWSFECRRGEIHQISPDLRTLQLLIGQHQLLSLQAETKFLQYNQWKRINISICYSYNSNNEIEINIIITVITLITILILLLLLLLIIIITITTIAITVIKCVAFLFIFLFFSSPYFVNIHSYHLGLCLQTFVTVVMTQSGCYTYS